MNDTLTAGDESSCLRALATFIQFLDVRDVTGALSQLAPDVVWHRQGERLVGHAQIAAVIGGLAAGRLVRHHLCNVVVRATGPSSARAKAYYAVYAAEGAQRPGLIDGPERVGDYHAEFARHEDGWLISMLRAERLFEAALRGRGEGT